MRDKSETNEAGIPLVPSSIMPLPQKSNQKQYTDVEFTWNDVSYSVIDPSNKKLTRTLLQGK